MAPQQQRSVPGEGATDITDDLTDPVQRFGRVRSFLLAVSCVATLVGCIIIGRVLISGPAVDMLEFARNVWAFVAGAGLAGTGFVTTVILASKAAELATAATQRAERVRTALTESRQREVPDKILSTLTVDQFARLIQEARNISSEGWTSPVIRDAPAHARRFLKWVKENLGEALAEMVNPGGHVATCGEVKVAKDGGSGFLVNVIDGWQPISGTLLMPPAYFAMIEILNDRGIRLSVVSSTEAQRNGPHDYGDVPLGNYTGYRESDSAIENTQRELH